MAIPITPHNVSGHDFDLLCRSLCYQHKMKVHILTWLSGRKALQLKAIIRGAMITKALPGTVMLKLIMMIMTMNSSV